MANGNRYHERENVPSLIRRRDLLKAAGALAIGCRAVPALGTHLRTKARKNWRLGITSHVYGKLPLEEAARRIKEDGFRSILTNYQFADVKFDPLNPDWSAADTIVGTFEKQGVAIAAIYGYYNVIDPDLERRKQGEARMECYLQNWKRLGCPIISTESGTFNRQSQWLEAPENDTEDAFVQCREALRRWARLGEQTGGVVTIEAYWRNVVGTIDRVERLLAEVDSPALRLVMDPCNYFRSEDLPRMKPMLKDMFQRLGPKIAIAHAKDVKDSPKGPEHPAPGKGVLDYPLYFQLLAELDRPLDLVIEHLPLDDVARSRAYVVDHIEKLP